MDPKDQPLGSMIFNTQKEITRLRSFFLIAASRPAASRAMPWASLKAATGQGRK